MAKVDQALQRCFKWPLKIPTNSIIETWALPLALELMPQGEWKVAFAP